LEGRTVAKLRSARTERELRVLGENLAHMRKVQGVTAELLAARAGVTRATLRSIERGEGSARVENVMAVLRVLGLSDAVVRATDPLSTDLGRLHAGESLPQRVRTRRATPSAR
jgi:transcriptional regulator with XRE-family HTH domain